MTKPEAIALANAAKRLEQKNRKHKEEAALNLEDIFAFGEHIKENWQFLHQIQNQQQAPQSLLPTKAEEQTPNIKDVNIQKSPNLLAAAHQSFEQMQDQQIRQQLKKQLLRDYELGEHVFEINIQDLGKISVNARIEQDAWHFALSAEQSQTQNWLQQQQTSLQQGLAEQTQDTNKSQVNLSLSIT